MAAPQAETVLLLVDLQACFCDPDGAMSRQGRDIAAMRTAAQRCGDLARRARTSGVPVIWTRMAYRDDYIDGGRLLWELRPRLREIGALQAGSPDSAITTAAGIAPRDLVIDKPRYSAIYSTSLEAQLRALGTRRIVVAGVTTSMCVETTVRDLSQRDYETIVVGEACGDFDAARHQASLAAMEFGFASVIDIAAAARLIDGSKSGHDRGRDAVA